MQRIIDTLSENSIYLNSFSDQPVEMWVQDIKELLKKSDFYSDNEEIQQKPNDFRIKLSVIN